MSIRTSLNVRTLNTALSNLEQCAEYASEGAYQQAKEIAALIGSVANGLIKGLRELGLNADACDGIREVEAAIYGYIKESNPDSTVFPTAEGFGEAMDGPARERVLAQTGRDMAVLRSLGVIQ